ncbi:RNA methyltransferase [Parvularcula lutaonensis]|nr:RNA methyltransferase [Parvularcula lutaonensis]
MRDRQTDAEDRHEPVCPHFGLPGDGCGGCLLQHLGADRALELKEERLLSAIRRFFPDAEIAAVHRSPPKSRRRAKLAVRPNAAGFRELAGKKIIDLQSCDVLHLEIFGLLAPLKELAKTLDETFDAQVTCTATGLDVAIEGIDESELSLRAREALVDFAQERDLARLSVDGVPMAERRTPRIELGGVSVTVPSGVFLQATFEGEKALIGEVLAACKGAASVADLFCGLGTFALPLSARAKVFAVDAAGPAVASLDAAAKAADRPIEAEARDLFKRPLMAGALKPFGAIVFDPPRAGAGDQAAEIAASGAETIVAVSCNPQSLARDAEKLAAAYDLTRLALVDQFGWSPHVEAVAVFKRR